MKTVVYIFVTFLIDKGRYRNEQETRRKDVLIHLTRTISMNDW